MPTKNLETLLRQGPEALDAFYAGLNDKQAALLRYEWGFWAREKQLAPPGDWTVWIIRAGRGFGKTRSATEWVRDRVESGVAKKIHLISDTASDVRDVIVEGPDHGLMAISPPWNKPVYEPSKRRLTWPNGAIATCFAAEAPELLRGPQCDTALADEPGKWKNLRKRDNEGNTAWDNLMMGLRLGSNPQVVAAMTPGNIPWLKELKSKASYVETVGNSMENRANLSAKWFSEVIQPYLGTRKGRREIFAEILEDNPDALWSWDTIEDSRVSECPELKTIIVAVDPQGKDPNEPRGEDGAETGIIAVGVGYGDDPHAFVLDDASLRGTPHQWGRMAIRKYEQWMANAIIGEKNFGGAMVKHTIAMAAKDFEIYVAYKDVIASRGKRLRAEPVSELYEADRVHHVGSFPELESQMTDWVPGDRSPDRLDALVHGITALLVTGQKRVGRGAWKKN